MTQMIARDNVGDVIFVTEYPDAWAAWKHIATDYRIAMARSGWVSDGDVQDNTVLFRNGNRLITVEVR